MLLLESGRAELWRGDMLRLPENYDLGPGSGPVDLLFDLRQMAGFTLDVAWEEIKFSRQHANDFRRVAVVTDSQWVTWSAWLSQTFVEADVEVFDTAAAASEWLDRPA